MIAHLRGRLLSKTPGQAIVECGGVGYDVGISVPPFSALPAEGAEVSLFLNTPARDSGFHAGPVADDVLSALVNLGYRREAAQKAIETAIAKHESTELTIRSDFDQLFRHSMQAMR